MISFVEVDFGQIQEQRKLKLRMVEKNVLDHPISLKPAMFMSAQAILNFFHKTAHLIIFYILKILRGPKNSYEYLLSINS